MNLFTKQEMEIVDAAKEQLQAAESDMERADRHRFEIWGAKLKQIRDNRWYIAFEPGCTWERYMIDRWEMTPQRAGQLIAAFEMIVKLNETLASETETNSFVLPARETHIRPLSKLKKPEQQAEVWQRALASSNGRVTAKIVEAEVQRKLAELEKNWITLDEWNEMDEADQVACLTRIRHSTKTMNKPNDNIEWAMWSWNPVTGCLNNCKYCYARDIANRFYPQKFVPSFVPDRLPAPDNTTLPTPRWVGDIGYKGVFVCSMADLFGKWVPVEWIKAVLETIESNSQWEFLLLTKFPVRMADFEYPPNIWLGTTVDRQNAIEQAENAFRKIKESGFDGICWLSCEPMLEQLTFSALDLFEWVVMGGASRSSQTPEYKPPFDDIAHLHNQVREQGLLIYQKKNLMPGISDEQRIREYPKR